MTRTEWTDRVLLIDDDRMSREVLAVLLEAEGYQVECAESGNFAVELLRQSPARFSVVLADVKMPGLAGPDLAVAVREVCQPGIVLLAMSASAVPERTAAAFAGFLLKPFEVREFAEAVERCRAVESAATPHSAGYSNENGDRTSGVLAGQPAPSNTRMKPHGVSIESYGTAAPPQPAPLDERIYGQLGASMPAAQLRQLYDLCLEDVRQRIGEMRRLVKGRQAEGFSREAHTIKGECGFLGASQLSSLAAELERAGLGAAGLDGTPGVNPLDELAAACDRLERMLATRT